MGECRYFSTAPRTTAGTFSNQLDPKPPTMEAIVRAARLLRVRTEIALCVETIEVLISAAGFLRDSPDEQSQDLAQGYEREASEVERQLATLREELARLG